MAKLVFGMNVSLDGYVDHDNPAFPPPGPNLYNHFVEQIRDAAGSVYGRGLYQVMQYWDDEQADWGDAERAFAEAWRKMPKWVVSRTLDVVGPNATLVKADVEATIRSLKAGIDGEIQVGGPVLAHSLGEMGLIDAYQMYMRPVVLGRGRPFFASARPPLRLAASEIISDDAVRLTYVPE